jgi:hypothetical protein
MPSYAASLDPAALKTKQRALRNGFPDALGLRVHRAISWLTRAENEEHSDVRFILLWIGFNAAYADNIGRAIDTAGNERDAFAAFFDTLGSFDGERRIYGAVWQPGNPCPAYQPIHFRPFLETSERRAWLCRLA